jgi:hypothetical protein
MMQKWLRGFRGAVVMILLWIIGWGVGFGGLIEAFVDPHGELIDIWPAAMAFAGLIGGIVYSVLLWISDRGRGFNEVSIARRITWGVLTGLALGGLAALMGLTQDIAIDQPYVRPVAPAVMIGITTALGAVAAMGCALFFWLITQGETRTVARR